MLFSKRLPELRPICWMAALTAVLLAGSARAQVVPAAIGSSHALWAGGEYSNFHASFPYESNQRLWGIGAVAEARFLRFNSFYGESEDNYLGGAHYLTKRFGKLQPYALGLAGIGKIQYPFQIGSGRYISIAPGGGASYSIARKWSVRGEYEYQLWLNSPNIPDEPSHMLTPNGFNIGIAYRLF
jgi:opacity protein-like surface antigen